MKNLIYINDWLAWKPYEKQVKTDTYYMKLANNVSKIILKNYIVFSKFDIKSEDDVIQLSCLLTSYFEDLVSETNIWNTFIKLNKKLYNKQLPFYELTDYYENEINWQDVNFLIWYYLNIGDDYFLRNDKYIENISKEIFEILFEEWEYAPENENLKEYYTFDENENDYYIARNLINNLLYKSYLFHIDTFFRLNSVIEEALEDTQNKDYELKILLINYSTDFGIHNYYTNLLSLKGKEWAAELLGEEHPLYESYLSMSNKIEGLFYYKGQDEDDVFFEHVALEKRFNVTKKSLENYSEYKEIDTLLNFGIVMWQEEWWFSGVQYQLDNKPDLIDMEKKSIERKMSVSFLDENRNKILETLEMQLKEFKKFNKNSIIAYLESSEIMNFINNFTQHYNNSIKIPDEEKLKAKKRVEENITENKTEKSEPYFEDSKNGVVFYNQKSGIEMISDICAAFPDKKNKFFNENESFEAAKAIITDESISRELAYYWKDNFYDKIDFPNPEAKIFISENFDFLLRFFKNEKYHTKPMITIV